MGTVEKGNIGNNGAEGSGRTVKNAFSKRALLAGAAICILAPAMAHAAAAQTAATAASNDDIQVVIVTANKRAENIQTVPQSVQVVTSVALEKNSVRDFEDIVKVAPSVTITKTTQPGNNSINIRGIGTYAYSIATEPSVAVVVDDVPQAFQAAAFSALVDTQQIEILRGPQNTLFGKATSAGVLLITTKAPSDHFTFSANAMMTDDHEHRAQMAISGPITDTLKFRLAASTSDYRGTIHNLYTGNWLNGTGDDSVRAKLIWTPNDNWSVAFTPYATTTKASCCASATYYVPAGATAGKASPAPATIISQATLLNGVVPGRDNRETSQDVDSQGNAYDAGAGLKISRKLGDFTLTSITSYDQYFLHDRQDTDVTSFNFGIGYTAGATVTGGSGNGGYFKVRTATQELRLTSPAGNRFSYVAGLFYSDTLSKRWFVRGSNTLGPYSPTFLSALNTTNSSAYSNYNAIASDKNYAIFAQSTFEITDKLNLVTGLRANVEDIAYQWFDNTVPSAPVTFGVPECSTTTPSGLTISTCDSDTSITGRVSLSYKATPKFMTFVTYSTGYKGMAYDLTSTLTVRSNVTLAGKCLNKPTADCVASNQPIQPETVDNFEFGFKSTLFDRHLTLNVTAFDEVFHGFQAQSRDEVTGQNLLNSIPKVSSKGVEMEFAGRHGAFDFNGALTYNKAVMDDFPNSTCYSNQTAAEGCLPVPNVTSARTQDLSGKPLFNAPEWNFNINTNYEKELSNNLTMFAGVTYRWQSQVTFSLLQDPDSIQKAYGIVNLSGGFAKDHWRVTLFCNNLFDKSYALTRGRSAAWNSAVPTGSTTSAGFVAVDWKPARDSARYTGVRVAVNY